MKKILHIAEREFLATAGTKAFIFAVLVAPVVLGLLVVLMPRMWREGPPKVEGEVAIVDPTGQVASGVQSFLQPDRIAARRQEAYRKMPDAMSPALRAAAGGEDTSKEGIERAFESALGEVLRLSILALNSGSDVEAAKRPLREAAAKKSGAPERLDSAATICSSGASSTIASRMRSATGFGTRSSGRASGVRASTGGKSMR